MTANNINSEALKQFGGARWLAPQPENAAAWRNGEPTTDKAKM